ncbi:hypothetical protein C4M96_03430, partial [Mycoplasmopsis pullorum]|uniref:hypothetical protein n=1 Tax=Mycoplasmopsis pullorum TaxID=48003 RepID=UPI0015D649B4
FYASYIYDIWVKKQSLKIGSTWKLRIYIPIDSLRGSFSRSTRLNASGYYLSGVFSPSNNYYKISFDTQSSGSKKYLVVSQDLVYSKLSDVVIDNSGYISTSSSSVWWNTRNNISHDSIDGRKKSSVFEIGAVQLVKSK